MLTRTLVKKTNIVILHWNLCIQLLKSLKSGIFNFFQLLKSLKSGISNLKLSFLGFLNHCLRALINITLKKILIYMCVIKHYLFGHVTMLEFLR